MALEINGVNKQVAFKGNEDQRSSGGMGIGVPIATTLIGGGIGYGLTRQPKEDEFKAMVKEDKVKLKEGELTEAQKAEIKAAKEELEAAEKSGESGKTEPSKAAPAEAAPTTAVKEGETDALAKIFGDKTEVSSEAYLEGKHGIGTNTSYLASQAQSDSERLKSMTEELTKAQESASNVSRYTDNRQSANAIQSEVDGITSEAKNKVKALETARDEEIKKYNAKTDKKRIDEIETETANKIKQIKEEANVRISQRNSVLSKLDAQAKELESKISLIDQNGVSHPAQFPIDTEKVDKAIYEEAKLTPDGPVAKEIMEKEVDKRTQEYINKEGRKGLKKEKINAKKADFRDDKEVKAEVKKQLKKQQDDVRKAEIARQEREHFANIKKLAEEQVNTLGTNRKALSEKLEGMKADLALVKDNKTITKAQAEKTASTVLENVKAAAEKAKNAVGDEAAKLLPKTTELFKSIGEKLAKVRTWQRGAIGAAIGLGAGIIIKLAFGGKSEEA